MTFEDMKHSGGLTGGETSRQGPALPGTAFNVNGLHPADLKDIRNFVLYTGSSVWSKTTERPESLLSIWKMFHGGQSGVSILQDDPTRFEQFMAHHEVMFRVQVALLSRLGSEKARIFTEGFEGTAKDWTENRCPGLRDITGISDMLAKIDWQDPATRRETALHFQGMLKEHGLSVFRMLGAPHRLAAHCLTHGFENCIYGLEPPNHPILSTVVHQKINELASRKDSVSDAELDQAVVYLKNAETEDFQLRHAFIADLIAAQMAPGMVGTVMLGASHFAHGEFGSLAVPSNRPLEAYLENMPTTEIQLIDERSLTALLRYDDKNTMLFNISDLTRDDLRTAISLI